MTIDRQHQRPVFVYLRFDYNNNSMIDNDSKKQQKQQVIIQSMKEYLDRKHFQLLERHKEQTNKTLLKAISMLNHNKNSDEGSAVSTMKNIQDDDDNGNNNSKNESSLSSSSSILNKTTQRKQYSHTFLPIHETQKEEATSAMESSPPPPPSRTAAFSDSDVAKTTTEAAATTTNNNIVVFVVDITRLAILSAAYDDDDDYYSIDCFDRRPYYYYNKSCCICKEYDIEWWDRPLWLWKWYERIYACGALLIYDMIHSIEAAASTSKTNNSTVTKFIISNNNNNNNNSTKWGNDDEQLWQGDWMFRLLINNVEEPHNNASSSSSMVQHDQSDFDEKYIEHAPQETSSIDEEFYSSEIDQEEEEDDDTTYSSQINDEEDSTIEKHSVVMVDNQMSQNKNEFKKESNTNVKARPESRQAGGGNDLNPDLIDDWNLHQDAVSNNCHNISEERIDLFIDTDNDSLQSTPPSKDPQKNEQSNENQNHIIHDEATTTTEAEATTTTSKPKQHQNEKTTSITLLENPYTRVYRKVPTEVEKEEEETRNDGGSINNIHETNFDDDGDNIKNKEFGISRNETDLQQDTISSPTDDINNNGSLEVEEYYDEGGGQLPTTTTNIVSRECTPSKDDFDDGDCDCSQNVDFEQHGNEDIMIDYIDMMTQPVAGIVVETTNTKKKNNKEPQIDSRGVDYTVLSEVPIHFRSEARLALAVGQHDSNKRKQLHSSVPPPSADPRLRQWLSTYSSSTHQCSSSTSTSDLPTTGTSSKKKKKIKREIAEYFS